MTIEEKIIDVMKGMEGIGGIPSPEEYYVEFDMRVKAALGLVTDEVSSGVSKSYSGEEFRIVKYYHGFFCHWAYRLEKKVSHDQRSSD